MKTKGDLWIITYLHKRSNTANSEVVVYGGPLHRKLAELEKKGEIRIDGVAKLDVPRCPVCGYPIYGGYRENMPDLSKPWPLSMIFRRNEGEARCIMCGWKTRDFKLVKQLFKGGR